MEKTKYLMMVKKHKPKEPVIYNAIIAFLVGGLMGTLGEFLINVYAYFFNLPTNLASIFMIMHLRTKFAGFEKDLNEQL